jgi:hypothetical protein
VLGRDFVADEPGERVLVLHGKSRVAADTPAQSIATAHLVRAVDAAWPRVLVET